jgi:hypothetical protein
MQTFDAGSLLGEVAMLARLGRDMPPMNSGKFLIVAKRNQSDLRDGISVLCAELERLGFSIALQSARTLLDIVANRAEPHLQPVPLLANMECVRWNTLDTMNIDNLCTVITRDISSELSGRVALAISSAKSHFFKDEAAFGVAVQNQFPAATFEISEASKCFAVARYTASVFHLMRVMEIGIKAVSRCLHIPDPTKPAERNWGVILTEIKKAIETHWSKMGDRQSGDGAFFESVYASLDAVKNPWRNATMHVERVYTDEEAEHIFNAVKGFMQKLATRLNEKGEPPV